MQTSWRGLSFYQVIYISIIGFIAINDYLRNHIARIHRFYDKQEWKICADESYNKSEVLLFFREIDSYLIFKSYLLPILIF